jgi:carboxypeptidase Q
MRPYSRIVAAVAFGVLLVHTSARAQSAETYRTTANRLIDAAMKDSAAWNRIAEFTDTFGNRLSGTDNLERAIDWVLARMNADGLEGVHGEPVMVPHWVRGAESVELMTPRRKVMSMLGLGGSVGTPASGITAPVLVVNSFDDLTKRAAEAKGKIVLFDAPFVEYGQTVQYRGGGASAAARLGAVAVLVRSIASYSINSPHTGALRYDTTVTKIPAAAITVEDAMLLHRMQDRGQKISVTLHMDAHMLPDAPSRNIIAEIRGRERPDEVVVMGGHIDSWDVGQGAMDDAGGIVAAWEALRLMKALGIRPRRTIRVVGWTNEENGTRGGNGYRTAHAADIDKHVFALESDNGVFRPYGIAVVGTDSAIKMLKRIAPLLTRIGADSVKRGEGEADIGPLLAVGVPGAGLEVDGTKYFWFHHTNADTPDKLNPREVAQCVAVMAVYAYVLAEMPERLPRTPVH